MPSDSVRVALYLPAEAERVASAMARRQGISRNAVFRKALGLMQIFEDATHDGHYVGMTRDRERLDTVIVTPI